MESLQDLLVAMELKYCERCGGLWLRPKKECGIYCPECEPQMADMPKPRRKRVLVVESADEIETCLAELAGVCVEGGNA